MLGLLASAGSSLLKNVLPSAINWGVNKLVNSGFGQRFITPQLMNKVQGVTNQISGALQQRDSQLPTMAQTFS